MSSFKLDVAGLGFAGAREALIAAAPGFAAFPDAEVEIKIDGYSAAELFASLSDLSTTVKVEDAKVEDFKASEKPQTDKETPPAENDNEDLPDVKRRTKEEIAAGLSTSQAAHFRASDEKDVEKWIADNDITPEEAVADDKKAEAEDKGKLEDDDDEPLGDDDDPDLGDDDDDDDLAGDEEQVSFDTAKELFVKVLQTGEHNDDLRKILKKEGGGVAKMSLVPADKVAAVYAALKKLDK